MNARISTLDEDELIGEFQVADYLVFLLSLDTYMRYAEETSGVDDIEDALINHGLRLLKMADSQIDLLADYLDQHLASPAQKGMLKRALSFKSFTPRGASRRALQFRTLLSRGGPAAMKGIFTNQKYVRQVREAVAASILDDADKALDIFAAMTIRNARFRDWIDQASRQAGSGIGAPTPVDAASMSGSADTETLVAQNIQQLAATGAEEAQQAQQARSVILDQVERDATESARKSLEINHRPDEPPVRSEVVGLATAAAVAALSDPARRQNVPVPLQNLDDEQRAAALTDGRVRIAAGAGSGKSTTLVARIDYLIKDKNMNPARIMATTFGEKAARDLKEKIASVIGPGSFKGVQAGTMHSLFGLMVKGNNRDQPGYGTAEEKAMLRAPRFIATPRKGEKAINPASLAMAIRGIWIECGASKLAEHYGFPADWLAEPPKAKQANLLLNAWRGNDVSLEQAKSSVSSKAEAKAAIWYDMYLGIKGDIPGWRAPCTAQALNNFMGRHRKGGERLGDFEDMQKILRDILKRDPKAKKAIQSTLDHILVDEAQDLNTVQHQVFSMLSEHVDKDSKDKSIWMVGDHVQAIYGFRGAKPALFTGLTEGWNVRNISTNYRCEPEIVDAANMLAAASGDSSVVPSRADPKKNRGRSSIKVSTPDDNVQAALTTIDRFRQDIDEGAAPEDFAVLARTNAELNDFETACIINEIQYCRKGGRGFLEAPESRAVLGYIDLASGNDYEKMKQSLVAVLMKPDRSIYMGRDDVEKAVNEAMDEVARRERVDVKSVRPDILLSPRYVRTLADKLKQPQRLRIIDNAKGNTSKGEWMYGKRVDELADNLKDLSDGIANLKDEIEQNPPTAALLGYVLDNMTSRVAGWTRENGASVTITTLRDQITNDVAVYSDDDDDVEDEKEKAPLEIGEEGHILQEKVEIQERKGLGAVQFLYALANPNKNDQANMTNPESAQGFVAKLARYSKLAESLRIDPAKWERDQARIADEGQRKTTIPAVTLSTIHAVKGAQWTNVTVLMPKGIFPFEPKQRPDEPPIPPEAAEELMMAERNLAYVAITRAAVNLDIVCPAKNGISPFVAQAGLHVGENVPKPGSPVKADAVDTGSDYDYSSDDSEIS